MFPGGGSLRRASQGSPRGPLVPPPAGHSRPLARRRPVGSGLRARAAIGSGPGWAGRGAPAYKSARRDHLCLRRRLLRRPALPSRSLQPSEPRPELALASHGDEGRMRVEGAGPGGGHHPLRAEGKGWGGGQRRGGARAPVPRSGGRRALGPPSSRPRRAGSAGSRRARPLPRGGVAAEC